MMTNKPTNYHAYLLRLWRADHKRTETAHWQASLEEPHTGLRLGFATLEQLFAYLMEVSEGAARPSATIVDTEEQHPPASE